MSVSLPEPAPTAERLSRPVTIVILAWNRWPLTRRCLESLRAHTELEGVEVLVVDNGSTDETPARLAEYPWLKPIRNGTNLGFVRGNNVGISAARAGSDVVLLNNDLEIRQHGWLDRLAACAHSDPDIGVVGCRLNMPDGRLLHAGTYVLPDTVWGQQIGSSETDVGQYASDRTVEGIVFACAYLKRETLDAIGGLSEDFESYFEDTDYCLRARQAGLRTVC
ncbi:MAG TPA: glycosyltransferase family 2 protein, partial [Thermoanaerobaculia bacterium]|nr:glycosyltransferase family 2 protein [Thermoanaerobaculia bacterium]